MADIEHSIKNVLHYISLGRDLGATERENFVIDVQIVCAAASGSDEAKRQLAEFVRLGNSQAVADEDWGLQIEEATALLSGHLWDLIQPKNQAERALQLVRILAVTPPTDWLSKPEIHTALAEFRPALSAAS